MNSQLYFNADDFGWTEGHNQAVEQAHLRGILDRVSLLSNGGAFNGAVDLTRRLPDLNTGVHLTLNEGYPLLPSNYLPGLVRSDGSFHDSLNPLLTNWIKGYLKVEIVREEWRAQIERALKVNIRINHLDTHKHVHLIPPLRDAIISLAQEYEIRSVRLPLEDLSTILKGRGLAGAGFWILAKLARRHFVEAGLKFADHFFGVGSSGEMTLERVIQIMRGASVGTTEVMVHPAIVTPAVTALRRRYRWAARYRFEQELETLCNPGIKELLP